MFLVYFMIQLLSLKYNIIASCTPDQKIDKRTMKDVSILHPPYARWTKCSLSCKYLLLKSGWDHVEIDFNWIDVFCGTKDRIKFNQPLLVVPERETTNFIQTYLTVLDQTYNSEGGGFPNLATPEVTLIFFK